MYGLIFQYLNEEMFFYQKLALFVNTIVSFVMCWLFLSCLKQVRQDKNNILDKADVRILILALVLSLSLLIRYSIVDNNLTLIFVRSAKILLQLLVLRVFVAICYEKITKGKIFFYLNIFFYLFVIVQFILVVDFFLL